jgi:cytochrome b561
MTTASRYHPLLVALHWLAALLILALLAIGFLVLAITPNAAPYKLDVLQWHMGGGMLVLALMLIRLGVRLFTAHPPAAPTGSAKLDRFAGGLHVGFYGLVIALVITGYVTGLLADLPRIVWQRSGAPLPDFSRFPTFVAHALLAIILLLAVGAHVAGALYHQTVRKDRLFARMSFGRREVAPRQS